MIRIDGASRGGRRCDGSTRRSFLQVGSLTLGGLALPQLLAAREAAAGTGARSDAAPGATPTRGKRDTSVILFWLDGGPTHMETYDLKPDAPEEFRGPLSPIRTTVPGMMISELFPEQARQARHLALLRSVHHNNGDHFAAAHWMTTGFLGSTAVNQEPMYPSVGAYAARMRGPRRTGIPAFMSIPAASTVGLSPGYFSATWLGASFNPFNVGDARVKTNLAPSVEAPRLKDRVDLLGAFDGMRRDIDKSGVMDGMDKFNREAVSMVTGGAARDALDVEKEPAKVRESYGPHAWCKLALQARRLVEAGATFVTVNLNGWDDHSNLDKAMRNKLPPLDRALGRLIGDLDGRGMLDDVLVVVMGEFGRTPRINKGLPQDPVPGRDHWGDAMSVMLAGGGLRGGSIVGATDPRGERPADRPLVPGDVLATIYHVLGVDPTTNFLNHAGRPMPVLHRGSAISELL